METSGSPDTVWTKSLSSQCWLEWSVQNSRTGHGGEGYEKVDRLAHVANNQIAVSASSTSYCIVRMLQ
jgi:hypothetical protein